MQANLASRQLFYPFQIKGRDRNNFFDKSHRENLVVFECVNRLLDKVFRKNKSASQSVRICRSNLAKFDFE